MTPKIAPIGVADCRAAAIETTRHEYLAADAEAEQVAGEIQQALIRLKAVTERRARLKLALAMLEGFA